MFCVVIGERTGAQKRFSFEARIDFQMCEGGQKCAQVRRRPQPTLSPAPSPERNDRLANLYPPSDICPYGEAPLVTTCRDTAKSVSFGFLRSRQGSELARNTSPVRASSLFFLAYKRAIHTCARVRRLAEQDAFALPHHPGHVRHPSQTHPIFISLPLWRSSPRLHHQTQ